MFVRLLSLILFLPCLLLAAVVPFSLDGTLDSATADTADYNTGGKITVGGLTITIPKNLQFQFSAAWVPFKDIAAGKFVGDEVSIFGNYVDGKAIAGMVQISQLLVGGNQGVIKSLAFDGAITLESGQVVRINDPNAKYSAGYTANPFYTADDENPSITAFSGFPMCVPRSADDPLCPSDNRPSASPNFKVPDVLSMAPFKAGDYITFSGIRVANEFIAYSITAESVQVLTGDTDPTFIRVEDAIIGTFDKQDLAVVAPADSRFIGYTSNANAAVTVSRMEIDACSGEVTESQVGSARMVGVRNKWTWRAESTAPTKYAREYIVRASTGTKELTKYNITAGQYIAPVTEWIFPEPGVPGLQPGKLDFTQMTHLVDGVGPDDNGDLWGQLDPFPDTGTIAHLNTCKKTTTPTTPTDPGTPATPLTANAGAAQTLRPGVLVTLSGQSSGASDATYAWAQTPGTFTGTAITLTNGNTAKATFTAPKVATAATYNFTLTVKSASLGTSATSTVLITNDPNVADIIVIDSYTTTTQQGGTVSVNAHTNVIDGSVKLSVQLLNPNAGTAVAMTDLGGGKWTYNARSTKKPSGGVQVISNVGGKTVKTTVTQRRRRSLNRLDSTE